VGQDKEGATTLRLQHDRQEEGVHRAERAVPGIAADADAIEALERHEHKADMSRHRTYILLLALLREDVAKLGLADNAERHFGEHASNYLPDHVERSQYGA
jgi:hypothetical protein